MTTPSQGWGAEGWGRDPWGGSVGAFALQAAVALGENLVRLYFSQLPYFTGLLDEFDASELSHYSIAPVAGTVGLDGTPVRPVTVLYALVGADPNSIDVVLDRPMTPAPSKYTIIINGIADAATKTPLATSSATFTAIYRRIVPPQLESPIPSRDFANPQTPASLLSTSPLSPSAILYGTIPVDDTGDYAFEEGVSAYKKRILRSGMSAVNGYAHLPGYGVGIPQMGKKLASAHVRAEAAAKWQAQILREPETASAAVTTTTDPDHPGLCWFIVAARTKNGTSTKFRVPIPTQ